MNREDRTPVTLTTPFFSVGSFVTRLSERLDLRCDRDRSICGAASRVRDLRFCVIAQLSVYTVALTIRY